MSVHDCQELIYRLKIHLLLYQNFPNMEMHHHHTLQLHTINGFIIHLTVLIEP